MRGSGDRTWGTKLLNASRKRFYLNATLNAYKSWRRGPLVRVMDYFTIKILHRPDAPPLTVQRTLTKACHNLRVGADYCDSIFKTSWNHIALAVVSTFVAFGLMTRIPRAIFKQKQLSGNVGWFVCIRLSLPQYYCKNECKYRFANRVDILCQARSRVLQNGHLRLHDHKEIDILCYY